MLLFDEYTTLMWPLILIGEGEFGVLLMNIERQEGFGFPPSHLGRAMDATQYLTTA